MESSRFRRQELRSTCVRTVVQPTSSLRNLISRCLIALFHLPPKSDRSKCCERVATLIFVDQSVVRKLWRLITSSSLPYNFHLMSEPLMIGRSEDFLPREVLTLSGPPTASNGAAFQNAMRREEPAEVLILDFSEVPYIDSAGLGLLVTAF